MNATVLTPSDSPSRAEPSCDAHVVLLTNYITPYVLPVYEELARRVRKLTVLLSTPMEANRNWKPEWGSLDVRVQRTLTFQRPWKHPTVVCERNSIHIPWNTYGLLRQLRPDAIISAQLGIRSLFSACYGAVTGTPLILYTNLSEHHERGRSPVRRALRRWLLRRASCTTVNGDSGARYLRSLGVDPNRLFRVPYTAVPDVFDRVPLARSEAQSHKLLYVGQLIERKGLVPFVEALVRWAGDHKDRAVDFTLVGSGPLEAQLRSIDLPPNLEMRVLKERRYAELADCYAGVGILAFPTMVDEWGLVVNEALAAGLPVLGSVYSQAVEELCIEGETGWTFKPDSPADMDAAIDRALNTSPDALNAMRSAGRDLVAKLTPAYAADRFLDTIHAALAGRGTPSPAAMGEPSFQSQSSFGSTTAVSRMGDRAR